MKSPRYLLANEAKFDRYQSSGTPLFRATIDRFLFKRALQTILSTVLLTIAGETYAESAIGYVVMEVTKGNKSAQVAEQIRGTSLANCLQQVQTAFRDVIIVQVRCDSIAPSGVSSRDYLSAAIARGLLPYGVVKNVAIWINDIRE